MEVYLEIIDGVVIAEHDTDTDVIELVSYEKVSDDDTTGKVYTNGKLSIKPLTDEELESVLRTDLLSIYKLKTQEVKDYISDTSLDKDKEVEYKVKGKLAYEAYDSGDYSKFEVDAIVASTLINTTITAEQYALGVLSKAEGWVETSDKAVMKMGTFRVFVSALITGKRYEMARASIDTIKEIEAETIVMATDEQLLGLFGLG